MNANAPNDNTNPIQLDIADYTPKQIAYRTFQETKNNAVFADWVRNLRLNYTAISSKKWVRTSPERFLLVSSLMKRRKRA
ncbi:hypothetical protein ACHAWC_008791 [Mediolabrus comicus]